MGKIKVIRNVDGIEELCIIESQVFADKRGYLYEAYNEKEFSKNGLNTEFVQDNVAFSKKGVIRGFDVNKKNPQYKLASCIIQSVESK